MNPMTFFLKSRIALFLLTFLFVFASECFSQTFLNTLPRIKPEILTDKQDRFFLSYGSNIYVVGKGLEYSVSIKDPAKDYSSSSFDNAVSSDGKVFSIVRSSYSPENSKTTYYRLNIAECQRSNCTYQKLAEWSSGKDATSFSAGALAISKKDNSFFSVTRTYKSGTKWKNDTTYYLNKQTVSEAEYFSRSQAEFPRPRSGVSVNRNGNDSWLKAPEKMYKDVSFNVNGEVKKHASKRSSRYARTEIMDADEIPHIFFHNPADRGFYHQFYSSSAAEIIEVPIDSAESGLENIAFISQNEIWSIHYFYRDSFNKGLVVTRQDSKSGEISEQFLLDASQTRNSGWELVGAKSSNERILISYMSDKDKGVREYIMLDKVSDLKEILANNFSLYGNPKGDGYLSSIPAGKRGDYIEKVNRSHEKSVRAGYLNLGAGMQYVNWAVTSKKPNEGSGVSTPYDPDYELSDSLLNIFTVEGKFLGTNFGLEYGKKIFKKEVDQNGSKGQKTLNKIAGKIGWDRLFFNFDFNFRYENTTSDVFFRDKTGQVPDRNFTMDFQEMKFSLLTLKRHHFGYVYQTYNFFQPVYIYKVPAGSTSYSFIGKAIGNTDVKNHFLHYGYSSVDYLVKYETAVSSFFLDGEVRGGLSLADFGDDVEIQGSKKPGNVWELAFAGQVEFGYIWYKRWEILNQIGGVIKLSYRVDYAMIGGSNKPKNLDQASTSESFSFNSQRSELRHGPVIFVSLNM